MEGGISTYEFWGHINSVCDITQVPNFSFTHFLGITPEGNYCTNSLSCLFASVVIIPTVDVLGNIIIPSPLNLGCSTDPLAPQKSLAPPLSDLILCFPAGVQTKKALKWICMPR